MVAIMAKRDDDYIVTDYGEEQTEGPNAAYFLAMNEAMRLLMEMGVAPGWEKVRSADSALVARTTLPPACYCKIFFPRSVVERLKSLFRGDRCQRAVKASNALIGAGFNAPPVLFHGRVDGYPYMVTRETPGIPFRQYLHQQRDGRSLPIQGLALRRKVLRALGREVGRLHASGFSHGDLRTGNVLVAIENASSVRVYFLDNEGTRRHLFGRVPRRRRVKNLAQLNMDAPSLASRTDRLRLFLAYLEGIGSGGHLDAPAKRLLRDVMRRTERRLAENVAARDESRV